MKKAQFTLFSATAAFLCIMLGLFIGRNTSGFISVNSGSCTTVTTATGTQNTGKLDLNTATAVQLQMLPGIGQVLADSIITYRDEHGPFSCIEDLKNVPGIGEKRLEAILEYITVGGSYENSGC